MRIISHPNLDSLPTRNKLDLSNCQTEFWFFFFTFAKCIHHPLHCQRYHQTHIVSFFIYSLSIFSLYNCNWFIFALTSSCITFLFNYQSQTFGEGTARHWGNVEIEVFGRIPIFTIVSFVWQFFCTLLFHRSYRTIVFFARFFGGKITGVGYQFPFLFVK